jgi:chaperonin cofactor prefoldin
MANHIHELEDQVEARDNNIKVLEDQLQNNQQQLEEGKPALGPAPLGDRGHGGRRGR